MPSTGWGYGIGFHEADDEPEFTGVNQGKKRGVTKSAKPKKRKNR